MTYQIKDNTQKFGAATKDFQFGAAVASFGMILKNSKYSGHSNLMLVRELAGNIGDDNSGYRKEFLEMVSAAEQVVPKQFLTAK